MADALVDDELIDRENRKAKAALEEDFEALGRQLARRGIGIEAIVDRVAAFTVAVPSWGVGTGGTRFARFPGPGEPRTVFEKIDDCAVVFRLMRSTPGVSLHIPWDRTDSPAELRAYVRTRGLHVDAMNSNTFQDQPGQRFSYKYGSLSHPDPSVRRQAVEHNVECIRAGVALGSKALSVWIGDGGNFPGQMPFRQSLERFLDSMRAIYEELPADWRVFVEHKLYEPAFYSTVNNDWGTSYYCARELGAKAFCLVDLGHHAPNVNIEMIVSRLIQLGKLGGFHFNDSKYGDDDLDAGSIKPFQLFLIFNELVDAELNATPDFSPAYMLDQSHNVTDPLESLMMSVGEVVRAYAQAHLIDRHELAEAQQRCDAIAALACLKRAFHTDVTPLVAMARIRDGGAIDPIATYRASGYRAQKTRERPAQTSAAAGIV